MMPAPRAGETGIARLPEEQWRQLPPPPAAAHPAAVVQALLDNARDAGASAICVEVRAGGRELIAVHDNGSGIPRGELMLAAAPHATSRIRSASDLGVLCSLGFHGQALADIAAHSVLTLSSRPPAQAGGACLRGDVAAGAAQLVDCEHDAGTTAEVRELFCRDPQRRAALRGDRTELSRIRAVVVCAALACPGIAFTLRSGGRRVLDLPAAATDEQQRQRLAVLLGQDYAAGACTVDADLDDLQVTGHVLVQAASPPQRLWLFLNGRPAEDPQLLRALQAACAHACHPGGLLGGVLRVSLPPRELEFGPEAAQGEVCARDAVALAALLGQLVGMALGDGGGLRAGGAGHGGGQKQALRSWAEALLSPPQPGRALAAGPADGADEEADDAPLADLLITGLDQAHGSGHGWLQLLSMVSAEVMLVRGGRRFYLIHIPQLTAYVRAQRFMADFTADCVARTALPMPFALRLPSPALLEQVRGLPPATLRRMGFEYEISGPLLQVSAVPQMMRTQALPARLQEFFEQAVLSYERLRRGRCGTDLAMLICRPGEGQACGEADAARLLREVRDPVALTGMPGVCAELELQTLAARLFHG